MRFGPNHQMPRRSREGMARASRTSVRSAKTQVEMRVSGQEPSYRAEYSCAYHLILANRVGVGTETGRLGVR
jgi:hypothetical protein